MNRVAVVLARIESSQSSGPRPTTTSSAPAAANIGSATATNSSRLICLASQSSAPTMTARRGSSAVIVRSATTRSR